MQHIKGNTLGKGKWLSAKNIFNDKVTKVARILAAKPTGVEGEQRSCTIMALLDGGTLRRHKSWFKVEIFHHLLQWVVFYGIYNQIDVVTNKWFPCNAIAMDFVFAYMYIYQFDIKIDSYSTYVQLMQFICTQSVSFFHSTFCSHISLIIIDAQYCSFSNVNQV
jgi:hypothetical protein